jgi:hypothetical protein
VNDVKSRGPKVARDEKREGQKRWGNDHDVLVLAPVWMGVNETEQSNRL